MTPEEANRMALAEAIADWAHRHRYTAEDLDGIDASGRMACARLARRDHPEMSERWGYVPSDATWDLAMRLLTREENRAPATPAPDLDAFRGFPTY